MRENGDGQDPVQFERDARRRRTSRHIAATLGTEQTVLVNPRGGLALMLGVAFKADQFGGFAFNGVGGNCNCPVRHGG